MVGTALRTWVKSSDPMKTIFWGGGDDIGDIRDYIGDIRNEFHGEGKNL